MDKDNSPVILSVRTLSWTAVGVVRHMERGQGSVSGWVQQIIAGDKGVPVEELWERYFHRLVSLASSNLGALPRRVADEEDVALSAFNSFCNGAVGGRFPQLDDRGNLWRLLVTITARKVYQLKLSYGRQKLGATWCWTKRRWLKARTAAQSMHLEQFIARGPRLSSLPRQRKSFGGF